MSFLAPLSLVVMCASAPAYASEPTHADRGEVTVAVQAEASAGLGIAGGAPAAGVGASAGIPFGGVQVEAALGAASDLAPTARVTAFLGARVPLTNRNAVLRGLSLTGAVGTGWWVDAPRPLARLGIAYDAPLRARSSVRLSLAWQYGGGGAGAIVGGVGTAWQLRPRPPAVVVEAAAAAPAAPAVVSAPPLVIYPADAMIWMPHPICDWIPASELASMLPSDFAGINVQVRAPGYLPVDVRLEGGTSRVLTLEPAPAYGSVVVVATPGDRLRIGGKAFPIAADGTAVFGAPEGPVTVEVVGGGRTAVIDGSVARGYALWLRAPPPVPLTVTFPAGSSVVPAEAEPAVRAYAAALGDHEVRIIGSYDPAEADASRRLASGRAEALSAALIAAGARPGAVKVLGSARPAKDGAGESERFARIEPIASEGAQ